MVKAFYGALSLLMLVGLSTNSYASDQEGLQIELTPYVWAAGLDGSISAGTRTVDFNYSFSDIVEQVDSAYMMLGVISYNRFVLYADYDFIGLESDKRRLQNTDVLKADLDMDITTFAGGYRFDTFGDKSWIDVMFGSRTLGLDGTIKQTTAAGAFVAKGSNNEDITDTIVMLRPSFQISEKWRFNPTLSYGISGDSDEMYEVSPQLQYDFSKSFALRFGYKTLHYKEEAGRKNTTSFREFDGDIAGAMLGVGWTFPSHEKPVAAAAPAPAPAPKPVVAAAPAKCSDADKDGVCDTADQCPNTPPGKRVGAAGCDCDYTLRTHFAFNSADLTAEDKAELDQLATVLMNPKLGFIGGEIDGYTDNVGDPAYNLTLSKRRADAVAAYLKAKGVALGDRFITQGFGEEKPIADNKTEEGRAQNRRATIHRTDCGPAK